MRGQPGGCVLWYDAVTTEGELKWQDTLNELNRCEGDRDWGLGVQNAVGGLGMATMGWGPEL